MINIRNYGHSGLTSSAYYWVGITNNFAKLAQAGAVVEAAYLGGLQSAFSSPLSNLGKRRIDAYSNVTSALRFSLSISGTNSVIPLFLKRPALAPTSPIWTIYS